MARLTTRSRSLFILLCLALCVCERVVARDVRSNVLVERQIFGFPDTTTGGAAGTTAAPETTNTNTNTQNTNTITTPTSTTTTTQQTTTEQTTQTTGTTTGTTTNTQPTSTSQTTNTQTQNTQPTDTQPTASDTTVSTTDANGQPTVVTEFVTSSSATQSSSAAASETSSSNDSGSGVGTGSIIGMSVAGGVAVIGVVAFFIWKFTRKRYTDFDDEPIKWPELNAHANDNLNYALPTATDRTTDARPGAGAGLDSASEANLGRNASVAAYSAYSQPSQFSHPSAADSTADLYAPGGDPYAVPPLPHLNPNQPYRDEPGFGVNAAYYDPYRGPLPQTFNDTASVSSVGQHGEAIPMNNLGAIPAGGRRSPGPQMGLDVGRSMSPQPPMAGRQSPGPSLAYGGRPAPGVGPAMTGRQSPGPGPAYGGGY